MFFTHFSSRYQLLGFSISGALGETELNNSASCKIMYCKFLILIIRMFRECSYLPEIQKGDFQKFMYLMHATYLF